MTRSRLLRWVPPAVLAAGALLTVGIDVQRTVPLRAPLDTAVPRVVLGYQGSDVDVTDAEREAAGVDDYTLREYTISDSSDFAFSVYVGYYDQQTQGKTIHSPKNCLPGAGWEALASRAVDVVVGGTRVPVNRYLLQRESQRALVLYWYQGRGRIAANEYRVKWDLLRDATVWRRSEEALVRVVVPVTTTVDEAFTLAAGVAAEIVPVVNGALPAWTGA